VGELADVDLRRQMPADRLLERLARLELTAWEGPGSGERLEGALPEENVQAIASHLEHDGDCSLRGC